MNSFQLLKRNGTPLLYLPLDSAAALAGVELYPAQSRKARLLKAGARLMLKAKLRVGQLATEPLFPASPILDQLFVDLAGSEHPAVAILAGNPNSKGRRFVCLIMDEKAEPKAVVKIGLSQTARNLIRREYGVLSAIPGSTPGVARARSLFETDELSAVVLDRNPGVSPSKPTPEQIFNFLRGWISEEEPSPVFDFPQIRQMRELFPEPLVMRLQESLRRCMARTVLSNGDFAPWNIREDHTGQWTVLDWERGELRAVPTWNWFHFFLQEQVLVHKASTREIVYALETFLCDPCFRTYSALCGVAGIERELLLLYLLHVLKVFKPAEGSDCYQDLLETLVERWLPISSTVLPNKDSAAAQTNCGVPDVSVVTPSYNQLEWLKLCTASVNTQIGASVEHIIQDAGTPDIESILSVAKTELPFPAPQLRLVQEKDSGMYDAINRGFLKARGEIVAWLNCDEQYLPGTLRTVVDYFREHPEVDVLFGDALLMDQTGRVVSYRRSMLPTVLHTRLAHLGVLSCAMFFRRSLVEQGFLLDTQWKTIADAVFVVRLLKAKCRMAVLNLPLSVFAMTSVNLGQSSLLLAEMERWRGELAEPVRFLTPFVIGFHRFRKLLTGAYRRWRIHTLLFRPGQKLVREEVHADHVSFAWPGSREPLSTGMVKRSSYQVGFELENSRWTRSSTTRVLLALAGLSFVTGIFILDLHIDTLVVSPFFCALTLLVLAFALHPLELGAAALLMGTLVFFSLVYNQQFQLGNPELEWVRVLLRLGSFASAATLGILFSLYRLRATRMTGQTFEVLRRMPAPVLVSDAYGSIRFANTAAAHLLDSKTLVGASYLRLFFSKADEGSANRLYREAFEKSATTDLTIQLTPKDGPPLKAHTASIGDRETRLLVTLIVS